MNTLLPNSETRTINEEHLEVLTTLSEDDPKAFIVDLLGTYEENWPENLKNLNTSCSEKNPETLRKIVHLIAGSSANLGLERLCALCRNVEAQIHEGTFTAYEDCAQTIEKEYTSSLQSLKDYISNL